MARHIVGERQCRQPGEIEGFCVGIAYFVAFFAAVGLNTSIIFTCVAGALFATWVAWMMLINVYPLAAVLVATCLGYTVAVFVLSRRDVDGLRAPATLSEVSARFADGRVGAVQSGSGSATAP